MSTAKSLGKPVYDLPPGEDLTTLFRLGAAQGFSRHHHGPFEGSPLCLLEHLDMQLPWKCIGQLRQYFDPFTKPAPDIHVEPFIWRERPARKALGEDLPVTIISRAVAQVVTDQIGYHLRERALFYWQLEFPLVAAGEDPDAR